MHKKYCDAEIGRFGAWHSCNRKPKWVIQASSGAYLEYCDSHKSHAHDKRYMTPATFAKLELIR